MRKNQVSTDFKWAMCNGIEPNIYAHSFRFDSELLLCAFVMIFCFLFIV